jgi:two-component system sensor histidine kinase AlgZ
MKKNRNQWAFVFLWVNLSVAVVALTQVSIGNISGFAAIAQMLGLSVVYANLSGVIGLAFVSILAARPGLRAPRMVPVLLVGIAACSAAGCLLAQLLLTQTGLFVPRNFWGQYVETLRIVIPIALVFGGAALVHGSLRERAKDIESQLAEKEINEKRTHELLAQARLQALESRIHPHFLFNTLNSISALISVDPARAEEVVERLAELLRASLDTSMQPLIPLRQELSIVRSYLEIQQIRFGNELRSSVEAPAELLEMEVPPMAIQALVENSVKHGIAAFGNRGHVWITASARKEKLLIEIRDSGPGFTLSSVLPGHGLDNLVARLDALFGSAAHLNVHRRDGHCVAEIVLPLV